MYTTKIHMFLWYTTRERCTTTSYHAIKYTMANAGRDNNGTLGVIPPSIQRHSCIFCHGIKSLMLPHGTCNVVQTPSIFA